MRTSNTSRLFQFAIVVAMVAIACTSQAQVLTNSYSFKDLSGSISSGTGIVNKATGQVDAYVYTVNTGTATVVDGVLQFRGSSDVAKTYADKGAYMLLPVDVIGVDSNVKKAVTLETWVSAEYLRNWSRVWELGPSGGDKTARFLLPISEGSDGPSYAKFNYSDDTGVTTSKYTLSTGQRYLLTVTAQQTGNASTTLSYYVDGVKIGSVTDTVTLEQFAGLSSKGSRNYLGKSKWSADYYAAANYTEFNVYEGAMGSTQVKAQNLMGPTSDRNSWYNDTATYNTATVIDSVIATANSFWDFSTCKTSSNVAEDLSGHGNSVTSGHGSMVKEDTLVYDALTSSKWFLTDTPSYNNYAYADDNSNLQTLATGAFTLASRVNFQTLNNEYNDIMRDGQYWEDSGVDTKYQASYAMAIKDNQLVFYGVDSNGNYREYALTGDNSTLYTSTWYDLMVTFDPGEADVANDSTISLYAYNSTNGNLIAKQSYTGLDITSFKTWNEGNKNGNLLLLETPNNQHGANDASIDYAGTWKTALGESQLAILVAQANMNTGATMYALSSTQLTPGTIDGSTLNGVQLDSTTSPSSTNLTISAATALNYSSEFQIGEGYTLNQNGVLSGNGSLIKTGNGTLNLNAVNTYTGSTIINDGKVVLGAKDAVKSSYAFTNDGEVVMEAEQQLNNLSGYGTIDNNSKDLTLNNTGDTTYSGTISGSGNLYKTGNGTQILGGANTFTGNVDILEGTLKLSYNAKAGGTSDTATTLGDPSIEGRTITVHSGASLKMGAIDLFGGADAYPKFTIVADGGSILSSTSYLTSFGDIVLKNGGTFVDRGGDSYWKTVFNGTISVPEGDAEISSSGYGISPAGYVNDSAQGVTFNIAKGSTLTVDAAFVDTGDSAWKGKVIKTGEGTMVIKKRGTYSNGTVVEEGTLKATADVGNAGTSTFGTGSITVKAGATLDVSEAVNAFGYDTGAPNHLYIYGTLKPNAYTHVRKIDLFNGTITKANGDADGLDFANRAGVLISQGASFIESNMNVNSSGSIDLQISDYYDEEGTFYDGVLTLSNKITGSGTINMNVSYAGTLKLIKNATLGNCTVNVRGGNVLELSPDEGEEMTISATLRKEGAINKTGAGTVVLNGRGTDYTGTFTISDGTVKFASTDIFGDAGATHDERFVVDGATITNFNTFNKFNTLTLQNGATLEANGGKEANWPAYMLVGTTSVLKTTDAEKSKIASLISAGAVEGANEYGTINPNATDFYIQDVTEDNGSDLIVSAVLSDANVNDSANIIIGTFSKSGDGTMELQAANTYTGNTTINGGTIKLTNAGTVGTGIIYNNGTLEFAHDSDVTFSNTISGTGKLCKTGAGVLYLNGTETNSISASQFDVTAGTLMFKGKFTGNLNVGNGTDAVKLSPGNSVGVLAVDGNVTVNSKATLWFEQDATGMDQLLLESGNELTIADDAILELTMGKAISGATYTIIENGNDFTGDYASDSFWNSLLTPGSNYYWNLSVDGNRILAQIDPNAVPEPSTWALLILGFAGLMWYRRRK